MTDERLLKLLKKYELGTCSEDELLELDAWYDDDQKSSQDLRFDEAEKEELLEARFSAFKEIVVKDQRVYRLHYWKKRLAVAATIMVLFGTGAVLYLSNRNKERDSLAALQQEQPFFKKEGGAILTLGDGKKIALDAFQNKEINIAALPQVVNRKGELIYSATSDSSKKNIFNTLATGRGQQYKITLPDGTKIWLNAATTLRYPTNMESGERIVELSGEAYFDVAHKVGQAFKIKVGNRIIEDIGTVFNVNAYSDEPEMKTTLIQGAIKVEGRLLHPAEQAQIKGDGLLQIVNDADITQVLAWQKGIFEFNDSKLDVIMRQISRWYDVDIAYEGVVTNDAFGGGFNNREPLASLLKLLEANGLKFRIKGRTLYVSQQP